MSVIIAYFPTHTYLEGQMTYAVIIARYQEKWLLVRHRERKTWEVPGGHIEAGETAEAGARRELYEETGALDYTLTPVCDYSVTIDGQIGLGRLFIAEISTLGSLPESEIAEVKLFAELPTNLTYPDIQPALLARYLNTR